VSEELSRLGDVGSVGASGDTLGLLAALVVALAWVGWGYLLWTVRVGERRRIFIFAMAIGCGLALAALALGTGSAGARGARFALVGGGIYLGMRLISRQDAKEAAVAVGRPIVDFSAIEDTGERFELATLRGRPFLLKFFRGHW